MLLTGIIIGLFFWISGILIFVSEFSKTKRCTSEASAVILEVREEVHWNNRSNGSSRKTYYYPVIEFSTPEKTIRAKTNIKGYNPDTFIPGGQIDIQYNPKNPYDLKRKGNKLWEGVVGMVFMFLLGTVFFFIGLRAN